MSRADTSLVKGKNMGFNHSIKVPTQYKRIAAVLKAALERQKSIKTLIFEEKHARLQGMQAVLKHYTENRGAIDRAIAQTKILEENPRLCRNLCAILVTELIYGRKKLIGESRPVETVRNYRERLLAAIESSESDNTAVTKKGGARPRYVRVNTNMVSVAWLLDALATEGWRRKDQSTFETYTDFLAAFKTLEVDEFMFDMHVDDLLIFHAKTKHDWATNSWVKEKKLLLQDKGTCLVTALLQPTPGAVVLDMCAAPGMKTIHMCNFMQNKGTIYAVERSESRFQLLSSMTTSAGCKIVEPIYADALTIDAERCPGVEYILVDPTCSGSGMQNRMSLDPDDKHPDRLRNLAGLQIKMLSHAMSAYPNVKRIAYSTCSVYEEENEQVVQRCLGMHPEFNLRSGKKTLRKWTNVGNPEYKKIGKHCIYSREDDFTDGIFIAIFDKRSDNSSS